MRDAWFPRPGRAAIAARAACACPRIRPATTTCHHKPPPRPAVASFAATLAVAAGHAKRAARRGARRGVQLTQLLPESDGSVPAPCPHDAAAVPSPFRPRLAPGAQTAKMGRIPSWAEPVSCVMLSRCNPVPAYHPIRAYLCGRSGARDSGKAVWRNEHPTRSYAAGNVRGRLSQPLCRPPRPVPSNPPQTPP